MEEQGYLYLLNSSLLVYHDTSMNSFIPSHMDPSIQIQTRFMPYVNIRFCDIASIYTHKSGVPLLSYFQQTHSQTVRSPCSLRTKFDLVIFSVTDKSQNDPSHMTLYASHDSRFVHGHKVVTEPNPNMDVVKKLLGDCPQMHPNDIAHLFVSTILSYMFDTYDRILSFIQRFNPTPPNVIAANTSFIELFYHLRSIISTANLFVCYTDGNHRSIASEFALEQLDHSLPDLKEYSNLFTSLPYNCVSFRNDSEFILECISKSDNYMTDHYKNVQLTLWSEFLGIPFQHKARGTYSSAREYKEYISSQGKTLGSFFLRSNIWHSTSLMPKDEYVKTMKSMATKFGDFEISFATRLDNRQPKKGTFIKHTSTSFKYEMNTMWILYSFENILYSRDSSLTLQRLVKERQVFLVDDTLSLFQELTILLGYLEIIIKTIGNKFLVYDFTSDAEDKKASAYHTLLYLWQQFVEFAITCKDEYLHSVETKRTQSPVILQTGSNFDSIVPTKSGLLTYMVATIAHWLIHDKGFSIATVTISRQPTTQLLSFTHPMTNLFLFSYTKINHVFNFSQAVRLPNGLTIESEASFVDDNGDDDDGDSISSPLAMKAQRNVEMEDDDCSSTNTSKDKLINDKPNTRRKPTHHLSDDEDQNEIEEDLDDAVKAKNNQTEEEDDEKEVDIEEEKNEETDREVNDDSILVDTPQKPPAVRSLRSNSQLRVDGKVLPNTPPSAASLGSSRPSSRSTDGQASQHNKRHKKGTVQASDRDRSTTYAFKHPTSNSGKDEEGSYDNILCSIHVPPLDMRLVTDDPETISKIPIAKTLVQNSSTVFSYADGITLGRAKNLVDVIIGTHSFYISEPQKITITVDQEDVDIATRRNEWTRVVRNSICTAIATGYGHVHETNADIRRGSSRMMLKHSEVVASATQFQHLPNCFLTVKDKMESVLNAAIVQHRSTNVTYEVLDMALLFDLGDKGHVQNPHQDFYEDTIKTALEGSVNLEKYHPVISFFAIDDFSIVIFTRKPGEFGAHIGRRIHVKKGCFLFLNALLWHAGDYFVIENPHNARIHGYAIPSSIPRTTLKGLFPSNAVCRLKRSDIVDYPVQLIHTTPEGQDLLDYMKEILNKNKDLSNSKLLCTRFKYGRCLRTMIALQDILADKDFLLKSDVTTNNNNALMVDPIHSLLTQRDIDSIDVVYREKVMEMMSILREQRGDEITIFVDNGATLTEMAKDNEEKDTDF